MENIKIVILSIVLLFALMGWVYFLIGAYKTVIVKDRSFLQFTSSILIMSGMLSTLFFLLLRVLYAN
jgi:hypothetical protein